MGLAIPLQFCLKEKLFAISSCKSIPLCFHSEVREILNFSRILESRITTKSNIHGRDDTRLYLFTPISWFDVQLGRMSERITKEAATKWHASAMLEYNFRERRDKFASPHLDSTPIAIASRLVRSRIEIRRKFCYIC